MPLKLRHFAWVMLILVLVLAAGCGSDTPEPTATPEVAEASEETAEESAEGTVEETAATAEAAADAVASAYPLGATAWEVESFGSPDDNVPMLEGTRATVLYFFERYAGYDGCSFFVGVYSATPDGELRMNTPAQTTNICDEPPGLYEQSALFLSAVLNVTEYRMEGEQLLEYTVEDQQLLTLNPATPVPVVDTEWELKFSWQPDREMWVPIIPLSSSTIMFGEGGEASGSGGCNDYTVSYEGDLQIEKVLEATDDYAELPTLTLGPVSAEMVECTEPEGIMDQELAFFSSFPQVAYYFKLGGLMMMLDADGTNLLLFAARD